MCKGYASFWEYTLWAFVTGAVCLWSAVRKVFPQWRNWLVVVTLVPFLAGGCATAWQVAQNPIVQSVFQRGIEYGVVSFLASEPSRQPVALEVVDYLQDRVDQSAKMTVGDLEALAMDTIPWSKMSLERQYTLRGMIEDISAYLQARVGEGVLDEEDKVKVGDFFDWMEQAIIFAGQPTVGLLCLGMAI